MKSHFQFLISLVFLAFIAGCSLTDRLFEDDKKLTDQSNVDFLVGVKESGIVKREAHFLSTDDFDVDSDIEFIYEGKNLIEKVFKNYTWGDPVIMQRDTFEYKQTELSKRIHYLRMDSPENPLELTKTYKYYYPDENTKVKVINQNSENDKDSIVYIYSGNLVSEEICYNKFGIQKFVYSYNADAKLFKFEDSTNKLVTTNYFDDNGLLDKTIVSRLGEVLSEYTYKRKVKENQLTIERYLKYLNMDEPILNSVKIYENTKLIEWVEHCTSTSGSEWWSTRYEYF